MSTDTNSPENENPVPTGESTPAVDSTAAVESTPIVESPPAVESTPAPTQSEPAEAISAGNENAPKPSSEKPRVQIGSQRDVADKSVSVPKAVAAAKTNPVKIAGVTPEVVPMPEVEIGSMAGLGEDLEAEIEAALGGVSMDSIVESAAAAEAELEPNSRVKATVTKLHGENVFFKLGSQFEGVASLASFKTPPAEGAMLEVIIRGLNAEDGLYEVGIPGSSMDVGDWEDINEGDVIECRVSGSNTGGLEVMVNKIRGFIPASQIDRFRVENFGEYVNQKLQCVVMEVSAERKKLVLSRRAILDRENEEKRKELMAAIEVGQLHEATITKIMDFGAFADLGGVEGLIHVSKLSWDRVTHPKDVVEVGQAVKVKIEKIDKETGKLSLSYRDTLDHPWDNITSKYQANQVVTGTVTKLAQFGAFVKLESGIEGLVHISEIAHHRVMAAKNHVSVGEEVQVKILSIDPDSQKMSLSIKATQQAPKPKATDKKGEIQELPERESVVKKFDGELKGGTNRKSGGESVGLNW